MRCDSSPLIYWGMLAYLTVRKKEKRRQSKHCDIEHDVKSDDTVIITESNT